MQYQLSFTIHSEAQIEWVEQHPYPAQFDVFLKMNSGMNRLGFKPQHYVQAWERLNNLANVAKITHMMHFRMQMVIVSVSKVLIIKLLPLKKL